MPPNHIVTFDRYRLDLVNSQLWRGKRALELPKQTLAVLRYLVEHAGQVVSKVELFERLWPGVAVSDGALTFCIVELRKALGDNAKRPQFIETVHRRGYRFLPTVTTSPVVSSQSSVVSKEEEQGAGSTEQRAKISFQFPTPSTQHPVPVLVGREADLAQLRHWLGKALNGARQLVFVTGEPGIGKTTLVEAFLQTLPPSLWVATGQCIEQYGPGEPYMPILEALTRLCRTPEGKQIVSLLQHHAPTWLVQMPSLLTATELEALQRTTQGATRERMLREMGEALDAITAEHPLVLILEDLHWSDTSTLELLALLARRREPARVLVIGTYRPVEVIVQEHPLRVAKQELQLHGLCTELPLGFLSETQVAEYLTARFDTDKGARHAAPLHLTQLLHQRTEGNPLFLVAMVDDLLARQAFVKTDTGWEFKDDADAIVNRIPDNIRHLVELQSERLSPAGQQVLEAASIAGMEFSAASVAAALTTETVEIERHCEQLATRQRFLRRVGVEEWQDGTFAARYAFLHAVYQQLWHERVSPTQLQRYHLRIGERKERAYGDGVSENAAELAMHFEQGRAYRKAVLYLEHATQTAIRRSANQEAAALLTKELALLERLPDSPDLMQQELACRTTLGITLQSLRGYGSAVVEQAYARAAELARNTHLPAQLFGVLFGLWQLHLVRAEHRRGLALGDQLLGLAQRTGDTALLLEAYGTLGVTKFQLGDLLAARTDLERSCSLYDASLHGSLAFSYGQDPWVACWSYAGETLSLLGYADQALRRVEEALEAATILAHPFTHAFALFQLALVQKYRGNIVAVQQAAEELFSLAKQHGFPFWQPPAQTLLGWVRVERGDPASGIEIMQQGTAARKQVGSAVRGPYNMADLACAYGAAGHCETSLGLMQEALAIMEATDERWWEAELYRLQGEFLLVQESKMQGTGSAEKGVRRKRREVRSKEQEDEERNPGSQSLDPTSEAEACFLKAIAITQRQQAKSLELRATMSLVRLRQLQATQHARRTTQRRSHTTLDEAHRMLLDLYNWFTEGFDTKDLQDAKALLTALSH